jgi:hypothetical protein
MQNQLWMTEHGKQYRIPDEVLRLVEAKLLEDVSYKNDSCPSFESGNFTLYTDHPDPEAREVPQYDRFCVTAQYADIDIITLYHGNSIHLALIAMGFAPHEWRSNENPS